MASEAVETWMGFRSHIQVAASTSRQCFSKRPWLLLSSACATAEALPVAMPSLFPWKPPKSWQAVFKGQPPEVAGIFFSCIPLVSVQGLPWHTSPRSPGGRKHMSRGTQNLTSSFQARCLHSSYTLAFLVGCPFLNVSSPISLLLLFSEDNMVL